jgi:hypothetical protein
VTESLYFSSLLVKFVQWLFPPPSPPPPPFFL